MPTLNWIGKDKVINHHMDVPYRILEHQYGFDNGKQSSTETNSGNKIIHGDNLEALKALLPEYEGKIKCIYIDPPYNTGEENWMYNDNVNDPRIVKWLGEVVGKEGEDLSRHDKWLCMIYPRLSLLKKLLALDGIIFVSIDDNEMANLKLVMDEILGKRSFLGNFIWEKRTNRENRKLISYRHDNILCYCFDYKLRHAALHMLPMSNEALNRYTNPDNDPRGPWKSDPAHAQAGHATKDQFYTLIAPNGNKHELPGGRCWVYTEKEMQNQIDENRIWFGKHGNNVPRIKTYFNEKERGLTPETILFANENSTNERAKIFLKNIFEKKSVFDTPKPYELIETLIKMGTNHDSIILDSFAGSGTTAHAVLNINNEDGGNRKFILVEMEEYAKDITAKRVEKIIQGYRFTGSKKDVLYSEKLNLNSIKNGETIYEKIEALKSDKSQDYDSFSVNIENGKLRLWGEMKKKVKKKGIPGSFDFYNLGKPLFLENQMLNEDVSLEKIREYVWFSETRTAYEVENQNEEHLLGKANSAAYYFYYYKNKLTTLDDSFLRSVKTKAEQYIIYADNCTLELALMQKYHITFKKIPRDITRF